jgi:proteasome lid subunit RPN8/RPN11
MPKFLAEEFKAAAKAAFPREEYAIILGTATKGGVYRPSFLYFPPDVEKYATPDLIWIQDHWWASAKKAAKDQKLSLLGDLHSHPWPKEWIPEKESSPSAADLDRGAHLRRKTRRKEPIMGICSVYPTGRGMDCNIRFWSASLHPDLVIINP